MFWSVDVIAAATAATCDVVAQSQWLWQQQATNTQRLAAGTGTATHADAATIDPIQAIHAAQIQRFVKQHRRRAATVSSIAVNITLRHAAQVAAYS